MPDRSITEHMAFMADPDRWPRWPLLPVKRYKDDTLETGYLIEMKGSKYVVYQNTIFCADPRTDAHFRYESFEAIVADGWRVD